MATMAINQTKLDAFMGQFVQDLGAALSVATDRQLPCIAIENREEVSELAGSPSP